MYSVVLHKVEARWRGELDIKLSVLVEMNGLERTYLQLDHGRDLK